MMKSIINVFKRKWYSLLLLIPSAVIAYIISLIFGFYIANLYHSDYLGVQIMKLIFAVITPLPMLILWKDIWGIGKNKVTTLLCLLFLQALLIGLFWLLINSF
ncbi:MAG: hypothetical protein ACOYWZ_07825 [Bacillota bacterium]